MAFGKLLKPVLGRLAPGCFLYRGDPFQSGGISITFDDGPAPNTTDKLLEILDRHQAKACFFLQGKEAEKNRPLVRAIHQAGHEIGNHGYAHHRPSEVGTREYVVEALRTQSILEDCVGTSLPPLFRPPYGVLSLPTFVALTRRGYRFVHWSLDSNDSFLDDAADLLDTVSRMPIRAGDILLFHDDQVHTIEAMPAILDHLRQRKLACIPVGRLSP